MNISIIIPCYNEEDNVEPFYCRCLEVFELQQDTYEYIFINDGSKDETFLALLQLQKSYPKANIICIDFSRNFGKEAAMYAGMQEASGEYIAIIDADLQQDPSYILKMKEMLQANPQLDCVATVPDERIENRMIKAIKQRFYKFIDAISEVSFVNGASDFRLMRKKMVRAILSLEEHVRFSKGIFSWVGFRTGYITYEVKVRQFGKSAWSFRSLFHYAMEGIISFSTFPLHIATMLGSLFIFIAICLFISVWITSWTTQTIPSMILVFMSMFMLLSGIQLLCMGILGEYQARIYVESRHRPLYIIREIYQSGDLRKETHDEK